MPRLTLAIDFNAQPLDLAAQVLIVSRMQEYAGNRGLTMAEREAAYSREFVLAIPAERMNEVLWDLDIAGLLKPNQRITGNPALHLKLEERFGALEWEDSTRRCPGCSTPGSSILMVLTSPTSRDRCPWLRRAWACLEALGSMSSPAGTVSRM